MLSWKPPLFTFSSRDMCRHLLEILAAFFLVVVLFSVVFSECLSCVKPAQENCLCCELTGRLALSASRRTGINPDSVEVSPSACDQLSAVRVCVCCCSVATRQQVATLAPDLKAARDGHRAPSSPGDSCCFFPRCLSSAF